METPAIDLKTVGLALITVLFMEWAAKAAAPYVALPSMLVLGTLRSLEIATFICIASFFEAHGLATIGIHSKHLLMGLKKGILWSVGFGLITATAFGILFYAGINPFEFMKTDMPSKHYEILLFFMVGAMISPIAEEIFFRGILYGFFRRWGIWVAVLASTLLFVIAHTISSKIPVPQAIGGILFAIAYEKERNLIVPMVIHMSANFAIFALALMSTPP
jgi:membrane protease YdiL (CAAX protease family)